MISVIHIESNRIAAYLSIRSCIHLRSVISDIQRVDEAFICIQNLHATRFLEGRCGIGVHPMSSIGSIKRVSVCIDLSDVLTEDLYSGYHLQDIAISSESFSDCFPLSSTSLAPETSVRNTSGKYALNMSK